MRVSGSSSTPSAGCFTGVRMTNSYRELHAHQRISTLPSVSRQLNRRSPPTLVRKPHWNRSCLASGLFDARPQPEVGVSWSCAHPSVLVMGILQDRWQLRLGFPSTNPSKSPTAHGKTHTHFGYSWSTTLWKATHLIVGPVGEPPSSAGLSGSFGPTARRLR